MKRQDISVLLRELESFLQEVDRRAVECLKVIQQNSLEVRMLVVAAAA
jgi:hypothetical protein